MDIGGGAVQTGGSIYYTFPTISQSQLGVCFSWFYLPTLLTILTYILCYYYCWMGVIQYGMLDYRENLFFAIF